VETLQQILKGMPPLKSEKNPGTASLWGFLLGGIGLGIYFRSFADFILASAVWLVFFFVFVGFINLPTLFMGILNGVIIGTYGYFRALTSNENLHAQQQQQSSQQSH
jgi:hypothetical protein